MKQAVIRGGLSIHDVGHLPSVGTTSDDVLNQ